MTEPTSEVELNLRGPSIFYSFETPIAKTVAVGMWVIVKLHPSVMKEHE